MDASGQTFSGKYLTFMLAEEIYGLPIVKVKEIIGMMKVTVMPNMPIFAKGVINLRDRIIPIIDLRQKLGMPPAPHTARTCIIVIEVGWADLRVSTMGIIVDEVSEVIQIREEQVESPATFSATVDARYILGMAKIEGDIKILLDIDQTLSDSELSELAKIT